MSISKHIFFLDENIVQYALKGTDRNDNEDFTCGKLLLNIGKNCHKIVVWPGLNKKLHHYLEHRRRDRFQDPRAGNFLGHLTRYLEKWHNYLEFTRQELREVELKEIYPDEDIPIVQTAFLFKEQILPGLKPDYRNIYIVTEDKGFFEAMQKSRELREAEIVPLRAREALPLTMDS